MTGNEWDHEFRRTPRSLEEAFGPYERDGLEGKYNSDPVDIAVIIGSTIAILAVLVLIVLI